VKTLLLWDIDGTLTDSGGAGERGLQLALEREFAIKDTFAWLDYFGRTDAWIARTILEHHLGIATPEDINRFLNAYLRALPGEMQNPRARILPGVAEIVARIARSGDIAQGLLTGNLRRGAEVKLSHFGLWAHFPFGAFANDAEQRDELGPIALRRANEFHGANFVPERVFVIGDTPHDIACGKVIGACTLAVATGRFSSEQLRVHAPTAVFESLVDVEAFFSLIQR
jgi:phosphoglycolate phosphatase-like HAD superfamily hydrolase